MSEKISFKYFYGTEADSFSFYRVPKLLFTNNFFKNLSTDAKVLYGLMLDRMSLSIKNKWLDEEKKAYIYFSLEDIMELLNCGRNKAVKSLQELDDENGIGLIEKRRQGMGKSNMIYVKSFVIEESQEAENDKFTNETPAENMGDLEVYISNFKEFQKQTSRSLESKLQEVCKRDSNNTKDNNNYINDINSNLIKSANDGIGRDEMKAYEALIRENISYEILLERYPHEEELLEGILGLILETVLCRNSKIVIASNEYSTELVKSKLLKLNHMHIEYVIGCLQKNTTKVKNIKKYLLASIFNAPNTISGYYRAEVNYNFPQYVTRG